MASSSPAAAAAAHGEGAVCCMCGDQGLADELFQCRCCRARLQHRYCSDLYPRAAAYRRCNWCLRAPAPAPDQQGARAAAAAADNSKIEETKRKTTTASAAADKIEETKRKTTTASASASDEEPRQRQEAGRSPRRRSRSPPSELRLGQPVKKKHRAAQVKITPQPAAADAGKKAEIVTTGAGGAGGKDEEVMRAGTTKARVSRVRVRRYKLLTEVISC